MNDLENKILKEIAGGSEAALQELYGRYSVKAYNTIISYTQNVEDAEEVLQDVFINVYTSASKFQFNSSVSTWIYRISVNKSLDFLRKKNSNKRKGFFTSLYHKDSSEIKFDTPDFVHPGVKLENKENAAFLFKVIDTLPDNQKTEIMKVSRKAVESLVQRAKANLRKGLEEYFPERGK